ncbi:DUF397 domain-containing protein [Streptomyces sp. NPDC057654]|uniref:DUF397 domain-containing protein n=1 Tax=Streptomyces sp. NPDC057654 TaxID=3346196 RepID=UPI003678228E
MADHLLRVRLANTRGDNRDGARLRRRRARLPTADCRVHSALPRRQTSAHGRGIVKEIVSAFRKSPYSNVEVAHTADGGRVVRDSKTPDGMLLFCRQGAWSDFLGAVIADEFPASGTC